MSSSATPRTLTQMLREFDQPALTLLLRSRPDITTEPSPTDFPQVAARATERQSVIDAVKQLRAFDAWVVHQACRLDGLVTPDAVAAFGADRDDVAASLARLRSLALLWGTSDGLRPVRALAALHSDADAEDPPDANPPDLSGEPTVTPATVDKVGAGSVFEALQRVEVLVEQCGHAPLTLTRDDEPTRKGVRAVARRLEMPMGPTTTLIEICRAARLMAPLPRGTGRALAPTHAFDDWEAAELGEQWRTLVEAWVSHHPASGPPWLKDICLTAFGVRGSGRVISHDALKEWLAWWRPQRPVGADRQAGVFLETAAMLGVTGRGALTTYAHDRDIGALEALLPDRIEHVVVQADLTAVAPGPLTAEAAYELGQLADLESRGGATVYRFSAESLRRAVALGWTSSQTMDVLERRSSTPLPQPLTYLVGDAARQPGRPRGGDEVGLTEPERAATPEPEPVTGGVDDETVQEIVEALLNPGRETAAAADERSTRSVTTAAIAGDTLSVLREAVETGEVVWVGYVDSAGASGERLITVTSVDDGDVQAVDSRSGEWSRLPVHRITAAHILRTSPPPTG